LFFGLVCNVLICLLDSRRVFVLMQSSGDLTPLYFSEIVWSDSRDVNLGGSTMEVAIEQLTAGLIDNFGIALKRYGEVIEEHKDGIG
jgi:hypothetical protein